MLDRLLFNILRVARDYVMVVGVFAALCLRWRHRPGGRRRLQAKPVGVPQIRREALTSVFGIIAIGSVMPVAFALGLGRHTHFYQSVHAHGRGWGFIAAMVTLMVLIQDAWFCWYCRSRSGRWPPSRGFIRPSRCTRTWATSCSRARCRSIGWGAGSTPPPPTTRITRAVATTKAGTSCTGTG